MYETYFNMAHTPFTRNVPPEMLYESPAIGAAFDRLCYVADRQLFAVGHIDVFDVKRIPAAGSLL